MTTTPLSLRIKIIADDILAPLDMELVDLEYKREGKQMVLRLYIDKEGGVTLDDCAIVSRELSAVLDVEDLISGKYVLEVSSPGVNRPLKKAEDYEKYVGKLVKVVTYEVIADDAGNKRKTFLGTLVCFAGETITVKLREGHKAEIPLNKIAKANLEYEF